MVSRAAPICMLFLRSHLRSITCGTVFRRIEEVTYPDDVLQPWRVPEKSFSGPARPSEKRKREDDNLLTNMRKFRRIQLIIAADMPTKVEVDDHGYISRPPIIWNVRNDDWQCCDCRTTFNRVYNTHCTKLYCCHQRCVCCLGGIQLLQSYAVGQNSELVRLHVKKLPYRAARLTFYRLMDTTYKLHSLSYYLTTKSFNIIYCGWLYSLICNSTKMPFHMRCVHLYLLMLFYQQMMI
jgi:hypothetical protein